MLAASGCSSLVTSVKEAKPLGVLPSLATRHVKPDATTPTRMGENNLSQTPLKSYDSSKMELAVALETARLAEQRGMDADAIRAYQEVRKLNPKQEGVAHALAVLYDRSAMTDAAAREYALALTEAPRNADVLCDHGYFLYSIGQMKEAEQSLRKGLAVDPTHQQCKINLAVVLGEGEQYREAETLFEDAIGPAAARHNIGMLKLRHGETETGAKLVSEASMKDPSIKQTRSVLDWIASNKTGLPKTTTPRLVKQVSHQTMAGER